MITIKLTNKLAYTLVAFLVILTVSLGVYAAIQNINKQQAWHSSKQIEVNIDRTAMSLQEAIDGGYFDRHGSKCSELANTKNQNPSATSTASPVEVPSECKDNKACLLMLQKAKQ
jgi:competence protein ComGC